MLYFKKSQPAPKCLERQKKYDCSNVQKRLLEDFKGKCYICETEKFTNLIVEHFKPHRGDNTLKFDWNNLFLACGHCNSTKSDIFDNLLNCTKPEDYIEERFKYHFTPLPDELVSITLADENDDDVRAAQTKKLLLAVFNGKDKKSTDFKENSFEVLREMLSDEIVEFHRYLRDYEKSIDDDDKDYFLRKIKAHLNKKSAFTSFKRQLVKDNEARRHKFGKYLSDSS